MASRNTVQKNIIYTALCRLGNHPTADVVYENIHCDYPTISRTTVYRVLNQLSETGNVLKVKVNDGADHFDHNAYPHMHIKCSACGRVGDVKTRELSLLTDKIEDAGGFLVTGVSVQFDGVCPECARKGGD